MGAFTEWLKLIPAGIANADKILEGIVADVKLKNRKLPEHEQDEIVRRRLICATCPYMSENAKAAGTYTNPRTDEHCIFCKCPITTRTASLSSKCGIDNYNRKHKDNPLPLKWDVYLPKTTNDETTSK